MTELSESFQMTRFSSLCADESCRNKNNVPIYECQKNQEESFCSFILYTIMYEIKRLGSAKLKIFLGSDGKLVTQILFFGLSEERAHIYIYIHIFSTGGFLLRNITTTLKQENCCKSDIYEVASGAIANTLFYSII